MEPGRHHSFNAILPYLDICSQAGFYAPPSPSYPALPEKPNHESRRYTPDAHAAPTNGPGGERVAGLMGRFLTCGDLKGCDCLLQARYRLSVTSGPDLRVQGGHVEEDTGLLQREVLLTHWHTGEGVIPGGGGRGAKLAPGNPAQDQLKTGRQARRRERWELLERKPQEQKSLPPCVVNTNYTSWNYTPSPSLNHLQT